MLGWLLNLGFAGSGSSAVIAPDISFGIFSKISSLGIAGYSTITSAGQGVLSSVDNSEGIFSKMNSQGKSVYSTVNSDGQSVESEL